MRWPEPCLRRLRTGDVGTPDALDEVYENVIASHRQAQEAVADVDAITEGAKTETAAARKAKLAAKTK